MLQSNLVVKLSDILERAKILISRDPGVNGNL
jgi:hypothetical protein